MQKKAAKEEQRNKDMRHTEKKQNIRHKSNHINTNTKYKWTVQSKSRNCQTG